MARRLNDSSVQTFKTGAEWRATVIAAILKNRAAIGEFQYHQKSSEGKRIPIGEPVSNYYPPIISVSSFQAVQSTIRHRNNHSGQFSKDTC
ncbi:recombinase family protein [Photobacterium sanguinicancri]|uniref:recombinase family protein n=1 Tax=Photobacterium sanguinicancri TaxID=875932 RepID=UPI00349FB693